MIEVKGAKKEGVSHGSHGVRAEVGLGWLCMEEDSFTQALIEGPMATGE